jgi:hypothetical protein
MPMLAFDESGEVCVVGPIVLAFGLEPTEVVLCKQVLALEAGLRVDLLRGDVDHACNVIAKSRPQIVLCSSTLDEECRELLEDVAVAVGAVLLLLGRGEPPMVTALELEAAAVIAQARAGRRPLSLS